MRPFQHAMRYARWLRLVLAFLFVAGFSIFQAATPTYAAILTVPVGGSLQTAVNNAQPGDVIRLAGNIQANESVNLNLMGSAVGSSPGNLTIIGINGASATLLGGNNTRLYNTGSFNGILTLDSVTFSTSASTTTPAASLVNLNGLVIANSTFDGIGAEGCANGPTGCVGLYVSMSSGTKYVTLASNTFRNIASDAVQIDASGTATSYITAFNNLFTDNGINAAVPNAGLYVTAANTATVYETVQQNSFSNLSSVAVYTVAGDTSNVSARVVNNVISNMTGTSLGAIDIDTTTSLTASPTVNAQITDNNISTIFSQGILSQYQAKGGSGSMNLHILRNIIQNVDADPVTGSNKRGIYIQAVPDAVGTITVDARNNTVTNTGGSGIRFDADDANVRANIRGNTFSSNNVGGGGWSSDAGIYIRSGFSANLPGPTSFNGAIIGNTIGAAGVKLLQFAPSSQNFETDGSAAVTYIQANNTLGGTVNVVSGSVGTVALNSVPSLTENRIPTATEDGNPTPLTAVTGVANTLNVLSNDTDPDGGDAVNLLSFQTVSALGAAITRDDNGTPANLTDDKLVFTPLLSGTGTDRFYYVVRDNGGRTSVARVTLTVSADSTPPDTTITVFPPNPSNDNTPTFQFTGTDNFTAPASLTFECRIDLASFAACTSPFTSSTLADGSHTFQVRAKDQAGNVDPTPASYTWVIDTTAPTSSFGTTPANPTNQTTANFTFSGNDGSGSGINRLECSLDGAAFATCTSPQNFSGLTEGNHSFRVRAVDNAGNTQATATTFAWVIDLTAPNTTITANPTALSNSSSATFQFTGSDPTSNGVSSGVANLQCSLDGAAATVCTSPQNYTGLVDGPHTFALYATDAAGNVDGTPATYTWTVDTTPPPAPVVNTPANGSVTNNPLPPVTGSAEPGSTVNVFIDGSSVGNTTADGSGNWSFTPSIPLANGVHTVKARSADSAGNVSVDSNTNSFTVDTVEPDTTFTSTPPAATNSTSANFQFTGNGTGSAVSRFECSLDGVAFATCTNPQNLTGLTEGSHTFRVRAVDVAGNTETSPASYTWTVDLTAPDTTITNNPAALSNTSSATFQFTGNDPTSGGVASGVASYECSLDGGAYSACVSPTNLTGLSDGPHTFEVRSIDNAGNVDATPASYTWTIDTTPPPAPVTVTPANGSVTNNPQPPVTGTAEPNSTVTVFIDNTSVGNTTVDALGNWSFALPTPLGQGAHTVKARASDAASNTSVDSNTNSFTVDTVEPDTTFTSTPPAATNSTSANFQFTGNGTGSAVSRFECSLDGVAFATCTNPQNLTGLTEGSHTFRVRAVDVAGNTETSPASYTWTVDLTAPDTTITNNPAALSNTSSATFQFTGNDPTSGGVASGVASYECSLDGGAYSACVSPTNLTGLSDGPHTFEVRSIDNAGNVDATSASYTWTIDTTPPPAPVTVTPANGSVTNNPQPPVTGTAEPGSTVTVFIDGSSVGNTTVDASGNWSFALLTPLGQGAHTVKARASDAAGNTSVDSNTNTFTVDTVEPDTTFTSTPPAATNSTSANFQFTGNGTGSAVSRFECSLDGVAFATCTSPQNLTGLTEGSHTFRVRAVDVAGNTETSPASYTWTVDLTAPDTTINSNPALISNSVSANFSASGNDGSGSGIASFECSLDGSAFTTCSSTPSYAGLSDGSHTFQVRAIDGAGNVDPTPASYTWTIDTIAPDTTVDSGPPALSNSPDASFTFSGSDGSGSGVASFECSLDGGVFATCVSPTNYTALADGNHTFAVRAVDAAGNVDPTPATYTWTIDATAPDTSITTNPTNPTSSTSATFSFTGTDNATPAGSLTFECSLDGAAFAACTSPQNLTGLSEGNHTFQVRAIDQAGNIDQTPASFSWLIDITAPDTTITAQPASLTNDTSAAFTFTGNDGSGSGVTLFECSLDGAAFGTCTSPQNYTGLADGSHTFEVRAIDAVGNVDPSPASYTWVIDTALPSVTINQGAAQADPTGSAPIIFDVVFSKPVTGFDASDITLSGTAPGTLTASVSGGPSNYTVTVSGMTGGGTVIATVNAGAAIDSAANANTASTSTDNEVTFAPTNPVVTGIVRTTSSPTNAASVTFQVTFSEAVTGVDAADFALATTGVTGAAITNVSGSGTTWTVTVSTGTGDGTIGLNLADNDTISSVQSAIALGGQGADNGDFTGEVYTLDRTAPTATLAPLGTVARGDTSFTFTVNYADNLAVAFASLDNTDVRVTGPRQFDQLATLVSVTPAADGAALTATYRINAPNGSWDNRGNGSYKIALESNQVVDTTGNAAAGKQLGQFVVALGGVVYMPLISAGTAPAGLPDLVVDRIDFTTNGVQVVIRNQGGGAVTESFWIDLYINPRALPTGVNQTWPILGDQGMVWGVENAALPLAPGASLTLTVGDAYFHPELSQYNKTLAAGTTIAVQVDSANANTTYGAVLETHEQNGTAYNNILTTTVPAGGVTLPSSTSSQQRTVGNLPARNVTRP